MMSSATAFFRKQKTTQPVFIQLYNTHILYLNVSNTDFQILIFIFILIITDPNGLLLDMPHLFKKSQTDPRNVDRQLEFNESMSRYSKSLQKAELIDAIDERISVVNPYVSQKYVCRWISFWFVYCWGLGVDLLL